METSPSIDELLKKIEDQQQKIEELENKNRKLLESQVKMGEVTNNYLMLHYLNKNIHECRTSQKLWETYLHNITDYGFNYDDVFILLPDDDASLDEEIYNVRLSLDKEQGELVLLNIPPETIPAYIISAISQKASTPAEDNLSVAIPIINVNGYLKGILIVSKEMGITFEDIELLEIYAQQTVSTIENITLNEKLMYNQTLLGEKINQFVMLHYVSKEVHDSKRYYNVLEKYLSALTSEIGFNFKNSTLYVIEDDIQKVSLINDKLIFTKIDNFDKPFLKEAYESGAYQINDDSTSLALPLVSFKKVTALIEINHTEEITPEAIQLLEIFAMQTATMLTNTKLSYNLQKEVEKQTYELQNAYDGLKKINVLKDEFLAMVSHELRTPLTSIMAYLETIFDSFTDDSMDKDTQKEFIDIIYHESKRLKVIVDDVLDLSKLEAGKMVFSNEPVNLNTLLDICINNFYMQASNKSIDIIKDLSDALPLTNVDQGRILQVISNILSNAIKFTPEGRTIYISSFARDNFVYFKIKDSGIGIKKEDFSKVFSKFEQIEQIDHHTGGTGLGMPISKMIIEKQGGEIWFESEFEKGTTFFVKFPKIEGEEA